MRSTETCVKWCVNKATLCLVTLQDMTREQIAAEKVALQKALLYYESIHGRPVSVFLMHACN